MPAEFVIPIIDLVLCLSEAVDLVNSRLGDHHKRVAFIAFQLGTELELPIADCMVLAIAGALHDIGGLTVADRLKTLEFEIKKPQAHAEIGYLLLKGFRPFAQGATLVRFHYVPWNYGAGSEYKGNSVPSAVTF